ncbi:nuclear hormone receptor FTZ-F1 [Anopheles marshallii]|uniref:nuclear hormone receptor FTZ-F1 n=1 Tax=Anopheles marshallii TaxID=1521116 RepID=UPI00237BA643|nr:nuclear hormone receptor FTZ-F1 [Anopheles marshallii]
MNSGSDFGTAIRQNSSPKHDFPLQNGPNHPIEYQNYIGAGGGGVGVGGGGVGMQNHQAQQQDLTIDGIPNNFPHRRSRASRTFKNPPQPHMCIKERTVDGKEVFINVLSWTRIANPDNPDAPIPLYGGMKVGKIPPGSPKVPPLVYAVMASPEVLKKAGRKCPDTPERMNLVDLMCEFVEAMNPSLHLSRKPEILKDRDLSGELKDVWSAVQACRDKGRSDNGPPENLVVYTEFGPDSAPSYEQTIQQHQQQQQHQHQLQYQQQYEQLPNSHEQQSRFPLSVGSTGQQQHYPYHHQQQSAINLNNHCNSSILTSIEQQISTISVTDGIEGTIGTNGITPTTANGPSNSVEMLTKETESLKLSSSNGSSIVTVSKTNGITLPNADASTNAAPPMTSSSSPTVPQTSPTNSTPVMPAKEPTKSSSGHNFFPMFRSSKSSNSSSSSSSVAANSGSTGGNISAANNAQLSSGTGPGGDKPSVNGGAGSESMTSSNASSDNGTSEPPKATKTSSKKSGLNFFRRNKSTTDGGGSKKEPSTPTKQPPAAGVLPAGISSATSGPATPAATGAASTGPEAKLQTLMDNDAISHGNHRGHQNHPYHLDSGSNGNGGGGGGDSGNGGEILETSATIAAK